MVASAARADGYELRLTTSLHQAIADACISYLRTVGTLSTQASHHAGRTHVNMLDVLAALRNLHSTGSEAPLLAFAASHTSDSPMLGTLPAKVRDADSVLKCASAQDHKHVQVPEFLPAFPKAHTFKFTPTCAARQLENASIRKHVSRLRRAAGAQMLFHRSSPEPSLPVIPNPVLRAAASSLTSVEHHSVAAVVALPYRELCRRELMPAQDESSMLSEKHSYILQQPHAHGLDEAAPEGIGDDHDAGGA
jgi:histone H3/H4